MIGVALGLGFFASGLIHWLSNTNTFGHILGHQLFYATLAFLSLRMAVLRIDKGWHRQLAFYALAIACLVLLRMVLI